MEEIIFIIRFYKAHLIEGKNGDEKAKKNSKRF